MPGTRQALSRAMPALACALALSSCGGGGGDGGTESATSTTSESTTTEESTTTSSTTGPTPPIPVPPEPADGGDLGACFDGRCDVEVSVPVEVPLDPAFQVGGFALSPAGPGRVTVTSTAVPDITATMPGFASFLDVHVYVAVEEETTRLILTPCAELEQGCGITMVPSRRLVSTASPT